jgi:alpha-tubulin suppressor-like RCC1 family protein
MTNVAAVTAGANFSLVLRTDNTVWSFGKNDVGQLGRAANGNANNPAQIASLTSVSAICAGTDFSMALKTNGEVWAWGHNNQGQLAQDTDTADKSTPVRVKTGPSTFLANVVAIACGGAHAIALKSDGTLSAWGQNLSGQVGTGSTGGTLKVATAVANLSGVYAIGAGTNHSLAAGRDGSLFAWGANNISQLGDGTTNLQNKPKWISGISGLVAVDGGASHSYARGYGAVLWGWGDNGNYQVGDGSNVAAGATYQSAQTVVLNCETSGATIYYTLDGSPPTTSSSSLTPGSSINVGQTLTLKAMAVKSGMADSNVQSSNYAFTLPPFSLQRAGR